jgi:N-acylneuraminate cytidylyltransferase
VHIAIIPVRGGSRRIPGKNIRTFNGRPLVAWAIEACKQSGLFAHILVSTDCEKTAALVREYGAETPFLRPAELADDFTPTAPVVEHAVSWASAHWGGLDAYCQIYANPFVTAENIARGFALLMESGADEVLAITEFPYPVLRAFKLDGQGAVAYAFPEYESCRSQDLPSFYHDAGQFYWHRAMPDARPRRALPVILPRRFVVDIDTEEDWDIAERLHAVFLGEAGGVWASGS